MYIITLYNCSTSIYKDIFAFRNEKHRGTVLILNDLHIGWVTHNSWGFDTVTSKSGF